MARRRTILACPPVIVATPQRHSGDCGVVALAQYLGLPYEQVFALCPAAGRDGLTTRQLQVVARKCGVSLRERKVPDLDEVTGILGVEFPTHGHWVVLDRGRIIDGDEVWDAETYLANGAEPDVFLTLAAPKGRVRQRGQ